MAKSVVLLLSPLETRTWPWGKVVAVAIVQAVTMMQGAVYDASSSSDVSSSYNDSYRRDLLLQGTLERLVGKGQSPRHGSCQLLKSSSPPAWGAEPYAPAENQADGV